jgi:hypothetical protein
MKDLFADFLSLLNNLSFANAKLVKVFKLKSIFAKKKYI